MAKQQRKRNPATRASKNSHAKSSKGTPAAAEPADTPAGPPRSDVIKDLLRFASALQSNAGEALRFVKEKVQKRLAGAATIRTETRFLTRAGKLSLEFRDRDHDFWSLNAHCLPSDPCRPLIDDLDGGGLPRLINTVAEEMAALRSRAVSPLTEENRDVLSDDVHILQSHLTTLLDLADYITKAAKDIRDTPIDVSRAHPALPPALQGLIEEAELRAEQFYEFLANHGPSLERCDNETLVAFLLRLKEEKVRLRNEIDVFIAVLKKFTDQSHESAEAAGHTLLLNFLRERERVLNRLTARRNTSIAITDAAIGSVARRLSLNDCGIDAVHGIIWQLNGIQALLDEQRELLAGMSTDATDERLAEEAASEADLPEWSDIVSAKRGDGSRLAGLDRLIDAFFDESDEAAASFANATKQDLKAELDHIFPAEQPFSDSWVDRHLKSAIYHKIVFLVPPRDRASRRLPDVFRLSAAAIRKYGPHVRDGRRGNA